MIHDDNFRILEKLVAAQDQGEAVVLAQIIKTRGSVPRHIGAKMLVYEDGRMIGTIGGGEMESRVISEASAALQDNKTRVLSLSLDDPQQGGPGIGGGEMEVYLEPYIPPATLLVIGCGHVGKALADLGYWLGFHVVVTDDRTELVTPENIPNAHVYLPGDIEEVIAANTITSNTYIALVTRNIGVDRQVLPILVDTAAPYIGVIGSKRRWTEAKKLLMNDGLDESDLERFHSPLGLEINAETLEEIAVSIMAEIIMLRRGGTGWRMTD